MNMIEKLKGWQLNAGAPTKAINDAITALGKILPIDYARFLAEHDGGEGFIGNNYLILWRVEELPNFNREYEVIEYAPDILLFGSDGGGEGYGFDTRDLNMRVVRIPFIGMDRRYATPVATSFTDLLAQLAK
jgi:cell wall assembly regulator SMI1